MENSLEERMEFEKWKKVNFKKFRNGTLRSIDVCDYDCEKEDIFSGSFPFFEIISEKLYRFQAEDFTSNELKEKYLENDIKLQRGLEKSIIELCCHEQIEIIRFYVEYCSPRVFVSERKIDLDRFFSDNFYYFYPEHKLDTGLDFNFPLYFTSTYDRVISIGVKELKKNGIPGWIEDKIFSPIPWQRRHREYIETHLQKYQFKEERIEFFRKLSVSEQLVHKCFEYVDVFKCLLLNCIHFLRDVEKIINLCCLKISEESILQIIAPHLFEQEIEFLGLCEPKGMRKKYIEILLANILIRVPSPQLPYLRKRTSCVVLRRNQLEDFTILSRLKSTKSEKKHWKSSMWMFFEEFEQSSDIFTKNVVSLILDFVTGFPSSMHSLMLVNRTFFVESIEYYAKMYTLRINGRNFHKIPLYLLLKQRSIGISDENDYQDCRLEYDVKEKRHRLDLFANEMAFIFRYALNMDFLYLGEQYPPLSIPRFGVCNNTPVETKDWERFCSIQFFDKLIDIFSESKERKKSRMWKIYHPLVFPYLKVVVIHEDFRRFFKGINMFKKKVTGRLLYRLCFLFKSDSFRFSVRELRIECYHIDRLKVNDMAKRSFFFDQLSDFVLFFDYLVKNIVRIELRFDGELAGNLSESLVSVLSKSVEEYSVKMRHPSFPTIYELKRRTGREASTQVCGYCGRTCGERGVKRLRLCAGCNCVFYCKFFFQD